MDRLLLLFSNNLSEEAIPSGALPSQGILQSQEAYHNIFIHSNQTWQAWMYESDLTHSLTQSLWVFFFKLLFWEDGFTQDALYVLGLFTDACCWWVRTFTTLRLHTGTVLNLRSIYFAVMSIRKDHRMFTAEKLEPANAQLVCLINDSNLSQSREVYTDKCSHEWSV